MHRRRTTPRGVQGLRIAQVNDIAAVGSVLAAAQRELGHDAHVVEPWRPGAAIPYPWKAATLPLRAWGLLAAAAAVRRGRYDVVHVHYARLGLVGPLAGQAYALHVHGSDIRGVVPGSLWGRQTGPFLRGARLVYYATPDLARWVLPFRPDAIFLPNPIETERFHPLGADEQERALRRDLLVGVRLDPIKGLDTILATLDGLRARRPETTVTIVAQGGGVERARELAGPNAVVVPRTSRPDLPELVRSHRVALGQFLVGSMGNYELEALASGVPVVMRYDDAGAYPEPPPVIGADTADAAVTALCDLLDDTDALGRAATAGQSWVEAHHAARTVAERVLDDYVRFGLAT